MQKGNNLAALLCLALLSGAVQAEDNYYSVDITGPEGRSASQRRAAPPPVRRTTAGQAAATRVIPPPTPLPAGVTAQGTHQIRGNDTLWTIANAYLPPERSFNEYQIIASLYRFNPHAFINGDVNRLITGATLNVPTPSIIALEQTQSGVNVLQNGLRTLPAIDLPQAAASSAASSAAPMSDAELDRVISNITPTAPPAGSAPITSAGAGPQTASGAQAAPFVPPAYAPAQAAPAAAPAQAAPAQAAPVNAPVTATPPSPPVASNSPVQITSGDIPLPDLAAPGQATDAAGQPPSDLGEQIDIMAIKNIIDTFDKKIDRKTDRFEKDMAKNMKRAEKIAQNAAESTAQTKVDDLMVKYEAMITDLQTTNAELRGTISKLTDQMNKVKQTAMDTQDHMAMMDARLDNSPSAHSFSVQGPLMWIVLGLGTLALIMAATLMALKKKHPVTRSSYHPADDDIGDLDDDMGELLTSGISINPNDPDNAPFPDDRPPDGGPGGGAKAPGRPGQFTDDAIQVPDELMRQASQSANTSAPAATAAADEPVVAQAEPEPPIAEMPVPPAPAAAAAAAPAAAAAKPARSKAASAEPDMSPEELAAKQAWDAAAAEAPSPAVADAIATAAANKAAQREAAAQADDMAPVARAAAGGATAELDAMADWGEALAAQSAPQTVKAQEPAAKAKAPAAGQTKAAANKKPVKAAAKPAEKAARPAAKAAKPASKPTKAEAPAMPEISAAGKAVKQAAAAAAAPAVKAVADAVSEKVAQGKAAVKAVASGAAAAAADAMADAMAETAAQAEDAAADMMAEAMAADAAAAELAAAAEAVPEAAAEAAAQAAETAAAATENMFGAMQEHDGAAEIDVDKFAGMAPVADAAAADDADEISADINMARIAEVQPAPAAAPDDMSLAGMNVAEALAETAGAAAMAPETTGAAGSDLLTAEAAGLESALQGTHDSAAVTDDDAPLDARHLQASLQDTAAMSVPEAEARPDAMSLAEQQMRESMFSPGDEAAAPEPSLNELAGMNVADALAELDGSRQHEDTPAEQNLAGMNVADALAELDAVQTQTTPQAAPAPAATMGAAAAAPSAQEAMAQSDVDIMSMLSGDAPADALAPAAAGDWEMSAADITKMIARSPADELSTAADDLVLNADITLDGPAEEALQPQVPHHGPSRSSSFVEDVRNNAKNDMFGQLQAEQPLGMDNMEYRRFTDELNLAHLYFETGDTDEAMNIVNEVIEKGNDELIQKARTLASQYAS